MKTNTHKIRTRILSLAMTMTILGSATMGVSAAKLRFNDVPTSFWGYDAIEALAVGGLVGGYGNGNFGPDNKLQVDQMATIIANAKGATTGAENGYWAYDALDYCKTTLRCLPYGGTITEEEYGVPCSRELAVYMIVNSLGTTGEKPTNYGLTRNDIPDYYDISSQYRDAVLKAYQTGLLAGKDEDGTFYPNMTLTRAEVCTILHRAGFTTAIEKPTISDTTGLDGQELYNAVKAWDMEWREFVNGTSKTLNAVDPIYGGVQVKVNGNGYVTISMMEDNQIAWIESNKYVDKFGAPIGDDVVNFCDNNGKGVMVMSSGWCYEARQLVKDILELAYPASSDETYDLLLDVMLRGNIHEIPGDPLPSAARWMDNRLMEIYMNEANDSVSVGIGPVDNTLVYEDLLSKAETGVEMPYMTNLGMSVSLATMYELDRG